MLTYLCVQVVSVETGFCEKIANNLNDSVNIKFEFIGVLVILIFSWCLDDSFGNLKETNEYSIDIQTEVAIQVGNSIPYEWQSSKQDVLNATWILPISSADVFISSVEHVYILDLYGVADKVYITINFANDTS